MADSKRVQVLQSIFQCEDPEDSGNRPTLPFGPIVHTPKHVEDVPPGAFSADHFGDGAWSA